MDIEEIERKVTHGPFDHETDFKPILEACFELSAQHDNVGLGLLCQAQVAAESGDAGYAKWSLSHAVDRLASAIRHNVRADDFRSSYQ